MSHHPIPARLAGLLGRLLRNRSGNTLAMIAAALVPLLAMVGGGIDMGRSYLSQTRLQQACDAGVLAARKKLGSRVITTGVVPDDIATVGNRFFNINFGDGSYGTVNRVFQMTLENDYSLTGHATVEVPTTIMGAFGYNQVDIAVDCGAKLNFSNTDIMFVLDTTGSMGDTNPGDTEPKIDGLRRVVKSFHAQVEGSKSPGTRVRYGFVPYSTNVNVGGLLKGNWMVDSWTYQSRVSKKTGSSTKYFYYFWVDVLNDGLAPFSYLADSCPANTKVDSYGPITQVSPDPDEYWYIVTSNGDDVRNCNPSDGGKWTVSGVRYTNHQVKEHWKFAYSQTSDDYTYTYRPVTYDVSSLKTAGGSGPVNPGTVPNSTYYRPSDDGTPNPVPFEYYGCIEERATYEIDDYANVDFSRALDLNIDQVPTAGNPASQWRPSLPRAISERAVWWDGSGSFSPAAVDQYYDYLAPFWLDLANCPSPASKLAPMTASDVSSYVDGLTTGGSTYHDIGMIWGARLLSSTGLFAAENANIDGQPTSRNIIFLTDGETAPLDLSYGAYGVEPLDQRRWTPSSPETLTQVVENRFTVACEEARKRNINIWVVSFGISLNPVLSGCAGPGHAYEAADSAQLEDVFSNIAAQIGELRITK
ncbi:MAG: pilus assembly protein TadG-related protein [Novosphingobium sp.]